MVFFLAKNMAWVSYKSVSWAHFYLTHGVLSIVPQEALSLDPQALVKKIKRIKNADLKKP